MSDHKVGDLVLVVNKNSCQSEIGQVGTVVSSSASSYDASKTVYLVRLDGVRNAWDGTPCKFGYGSEDIARVDEAGIHLAKDALMSMRRSAMERVREEMRCVAGIDKRIVDLCGLEAKQ